MNFQNNLNLNFSSLNFFQKIIGINVLMFIIYRLSSVFGFQDEIISLLSLDLNILTKPWSIISYAFIHQGLFELIFMIFLLLFTTNSISNLLGQKISINLFFTGIFFGGIIYLFSGSQSPLIGASAGISSLLMFLLLLSPDLGLRVFRFTIKYKYLMAFILFTDFLKLISPGQFGVYSHFGGYLVGAYYYYSLYGFPKFTKRKKSPSKRYSNENKQTKVDKILDKISKSGYDSLDKDEKEYLFKQGGKK